MNIAIASLLDDGHYIFIENTDDIYDIVDAPIAKDKDGNILQLRYTEAALGEFNKVD